MKEGLTGQVGPIFDFLYFLLSFLHSPEFFWSRGALRGNLGPERGEFCFQSGQEFRATRDRSQSVDRLVVSPGRHVEVGQLQGRFRREGGVSGGGEAGVNLAGSGDGGLSIRLFEFGEEFAGPLGLRKALEVI